MSDSSLPFQLLTIEQACQQVREGKVIAYPTEAVFGLGCDPKNEQALQNLLGLKNRPQEKGFILLASEMDQLNDFVEWSQLTDETMKLIQESWKEPVTWLVPAKPSVSKNLRGKHETIAVRVSTHPVVIELCLALDGPIVSTSANISEYEAARSHEEIAKQFSQKVDCLQGNLGSFANPSRIFDALTGQQIR